MKNKTLIIGVVVAVIVIAGLAIIFSNRSTTVSTPDGDVTVDQSGDTVTVNTEDGTAQAGENVTIPSGFPSDVHVTDGKLLAAIELNDDSSYTLNIESTQSVADVKAEYEEEMANDGWTVNSSLTLPTGSTILAEKDDRTMTVTIGEQDGATFVAVNTSTLE